MMPRPDTDEWIEAGELVMAAAGEGEGEAGACRGGGEVRKVRLEWMRPSGEAETSNLNFTVLVMSNEGESVEEVEGGRKSSCWCVSLLLKEEDAVV